MDDQYFQKLDHSSDSYKTYFLVESEWFIYIYNATFLQYSTISWMKGPTHKGVGG